MLKPSLEESTVCFSLHARLVLISQTHDTSFNLALVSKVLLARLVWISQTHNISFNLALVSKVLLQRITIEIVLLRVAQLQLSALLTSKALFIRNICVYYRLQFVSKPQKDAF